MRHIGEAALPAIRKVEPAVDHRLAAALRHPRRPRSDIIDIKPKMIDPFTMSFEKIPSRMLSIQNLDIFVIYSTELTQCNPEGTR